MGEILKEVFVLKREIKKLITKELMKYHIALATMHFGGCTLHKKKKPDVKLLQKMGSEATGGVRIIFLSK